MYLTFMSVVYWTLALAWVGLIVAGLWLVARGFGLRDGSGDRRCPACWQALYHTPGRVCNECGFVAGSTMDLYPSQLRWDRMVLGGVLLSVALMPMVVSLVADPAKSIVASGDEYWLRLMGQVMLYGAAGLGLFGVWSRVKRRKRRGQFVSRWPVAMTVCLLVLWGWPLSRWPERDEKAWVWLVPRAAWRGVEQISRWPN